MQKGKVNFLIGLSFGSEGKGNVAAYLAKKNDFDLAISNHGPNAGHSCMLGGESKVVKMVPVAGIYNKKTNVLLGSGSIIDEAVLLREIDEYGMADRINVSAFAPVVNEYCKEYEREHLQYIASTFQGTGAAVGLKCMRSQKIELVKDRPALEKYCHYHVPDIIINRIGEHSHTALCEIAQGYGLTIDSEHYPRVTGRIVNIGQALGYLDIPASLVGDRIGITRTYIIRVGNVEKGSSGGTFYDSKEVTWEELSQKLGRDTIEFTSVTKRKRRVFTFSKALFEMSVRRNDINVLFISFWDYLDDKERGEFLDYIKKFKFKEVYTVSGYWDFDKNIERIK